MSADALNNARRKLNEVLGEKFSNYHYLLKQWFCMKITKEEFDREARKLFHSDHGQAHNEFLLALFNKVEGLAETSIAQGIANVYRNSKKHKRNIRTSEKTYFDTPDLIEYLSPNSPTAAGSDGVKYATQEIFLPDHGLVVGRFMLSAWDIGLESVDDDAANIVVVAVQHFLKNIISAAIIQRKGYKKRNKHFMHDIGGEMPNMWLRNSMKLYNPQDEGRVNVNDSADGLGPRCPPTIDEMEHSAAFEIACSTSSNDRSEDKLTIEEFYNMFRTNRNIIACHSVYALNMERIAALLNHPTN